MSALRRLLPHPTTHDIMRLGGRAGTRAVRLQSEKLQMLYFAFAGAVAAGDPPDLPVILARKR